MVLGSLRGQGCIGAHHHLSQGGPRRAGWACMGLQQAAQLGALEMLSRQPGERQPAWRCQGLPQACTGLQQDGELDNLALWQQAWS